MQSSSGTAPWPPATPTFLPLEEKWYRRDEVALGVRQFIVQDPDGYLLRLSQDIGTRPAR